MDGRRDLSFGGIDEVMPEVERLLAGHEVAGAWTLGQILDHLARSILLNVRGKPRPPDDPADPDLERLHRVRRRLFFRSGRYPEGVDVPLEALRPPVDADPTARAGSLRKALLAFEAAGGPFPEHPLLGGMAKEEWQEFHKLHCAHHLGFARVARPA